MAEHSKIEWTDATFNPWVGCTKISPACDNCYAEGWAKRSGSGELWQGARQRTSAENWRKPLAWNKKAAASGENRFVFCASLADVFDNQVPSDWRADLWPLIRATPALTWQLLTKRPQNIAKMLPPDWGTGYANVWLGTTAENQDEADRRVPHLLAVPAKVRFLSCEPLLGPLDLGRYLGVNHGHTEKHGSTCLQGSHCGGVEGRPGRDGVAAISAQVRQMDRRNESDRLQTTSSGAFDGRISSSAVNDRRCPSVSASAPTGMAPLPRTHSQPSDDQPHQRLQNRQQTGELGVGNTLRADDARSPVPWENVSGWGEEQQRSAFGCGRGGNPSEARSRGISQDNRDRLRGIQSDDIEDCPERATKICWVIAGGESGPGARPSHPDWFRSLRDQCAAARVPFFFKQHGDWVREAQSPPDAIMPAVATRFWGDDEPPAFKVGKARAGRLLDGRTHDEFPETRT